jgi:hypothetical protein
MNASPDEWNARKKRIKKMRRTITLAMLGLVLLFGGAGTSSAEVKRVEMHIAGYLCGN